MKKAFIFDFDGVIVDSESLWSQKKKDLFPDLFGPKIGHKLIDTMGLSMDAIYERASELGTDVSKDTYLQAMLETAKAIYGNLPLTNGIEELVTELKRLSLHIGIVTSSPSTWLEPTLRSLPFRNDVEAVVSVYDRPDLANKPAPDGYLEAMRLLGSNADTTIVLEDSNFGIESAMASGAFTIAFVQHLAPGYKQRVADASAKTMSEVLSIVRHKTKSD